MLISLLPTYSKSHLPHLRGHYMSALAEDTLTSHAPHLYPQHSLRMANSTTGRVQVGLQTPVQGWQISPRYASTLPNFTCDRHDILSRWARVSGVQPESQIRVRASVSKLKVPNPRRPPQSQVTTRTVGHLSRQHHIQRGLCKNHHHGVSWGLR